MLGLIVLAVALAPARAASPRPQEPDEDEREIRSFAIPQTSEARALMDQARSHVAARRWSDAIAVLQDLLEEHRGEVLGPRTVDEDGAWRSQQPVHLGAAAEARRLLATLPEPARELYRQRFDAESRAALERARASADRAALIEVARRYPLTEAARLAWWSIGDLELELGHLEAARAAWRRAAQACEEAGEPLGAGALARLDFAFPAELDSRGAEEPDGAARAAEPLAPPGPGSQSWRVRIDGEINSNPFSPRYYGENYNLLPLLAGDTVLVSNSLSLTAIDAWTGHVRWTTPEPEGWREVDEERVRGAKELVKRGDFFHAIDREGALIVPAARGRVALAALQIPVTHVDNESFQGIPITTILPDRRLFAFDLETGRELWNHRPPPDWDGESGRFQDRMRVAGPPVISGSRVLVPVYRPQGRIDYHVACYDLFSGKLLWSTGVISGQRPLNMFGRLSIEFSAAPLVVHGETVLALTQLGAVAALDLFSGDILWETLYESIPLPRNDRRWDAPRLPQDWNNAAPVVTDGVVIATPLDSTDLIGLDAESGALLWSVSQSSLVGRARARWTLLGADEDTVYLAGPSIVACRAPGGLAGPRPPSEVHTTPPLPSETLPRPAFGERWIVAPTSERRAVFDRLNLRFENHQLSAPWERGQEYGNALLVEGALFTLTVKYLTCIYDWEVQERRFESALAADPGDDPLAFAFAGMLLDRARYAAGEADHSGALSQLERARKELEPRTAVDERGVRTRARATLHRLLRMEAEVLARQADSRGALERLEQARELAPTLETLRDTLIEEARLHANRGETEERMQVLDELAERCSALRLPVSTSVLAAEDDEAPRPERDMLVGRWVAVERARELRRSGAATAEMELLHTLLADWGDVPLGLEAGVPLVAERIAELLAEQGPGIYAPFEAQAQALLEAALDEGDAAGLDRVVELYPHSAAARDANLQRIELAWRARDVSALARLVQERLPERWIADTASSDEIAWLCKLATLLDERGSHELATGWLEALAGARPDVATGIDATGTVGDLAAEIAGRAPALHAPAPVTFGPGLTARALLPDALRHIGRVPQQGEETGELFVFVESRSRTAESLSVFGSEEPDTRRWKLDLERLRAGQRAAQIHVVLPAAIVLPGNGGLMAVDPGSGRLLWRRRLTVEGLLDLEGSAGVVLATLSTPEQGERLLALDAVTGIELWTLPLAPGLHARPIVGPRHAVLLPRRAGGPEAEVRDLFTGRLAHTVALAEEVGDADLRGAWIEGPTLVLPTFPRPGARSGTTGDCVIGIDLDGGRRAWRVARDQTRELDSIVRVAGDTYLLLFPRSFSGGVSGSIVQLDTRLGAIRPLSGVRLTPEDMPIGVGRSSVTLLDEPWLLLVGPVPGGQESVLRAVNLPFGERWAHRLSVRPDELYNTPPPLPVLSQSTLALAYSELDDTQQGPAHRSRTKLLLLDAASGLPRGARELPDALGRADSLHLLASGSSLYVEGREALLVLSER